MNEDNTLWTGTDNTGTDSPAETVTATPPDSPETKNQTDTTMEPQNGQTMTADTPTDTPPDGTKGTTPADPSPTSPTPTGAETGTIPEITVYGLHNEYLLLQARVTSLTGIMRSMVDGAGTQDAIIDAMKDHIFALEKQINALTERADQADLMMARVSVALSSPIARMFGMGI